MSVDNFAQMTRIIGTESARLDREVIKVSGRDMREGFRMSFESAAGRFARGTYSLPEFRGVVGELIRDASGTAAQQDRDASAAGTVTTGSKRRGPWATMPTDGSGRLGKGERGVIGLLMVAAVGVLVYLAFLLIGAYGPDRNSGTPVPSLGTASVASVAWISELATETRAGGKFGTPRVTLELNDLPNSDCWYEVTMTDADGQPGGQKFANIQPLCP